MFLPDGKKRAHSVGHCMEPKSKSKSEENVGYRASLSRGTRAGGQSASAKHKYQNRLENYLVGREGVRDDLIAQGSGNLPAFAGGDAGKYWLAVDSYERKNARLFIELQLNLPRELSLEQQKEAVQSYASKLCDEESLPFSWVIHHGKDENPHCHLMISETKNDAIDRPEEQHFKRFNSKYPERGGAQKTAALKPKQWLLDARGAWAMTANDHLEKAGFERHFDHRSLEDQRTAALLGRDWRRAAELDRAVGEHEGWRIAALRRKHEAGELDELPQYAKKVIESNDSIQSINAAHLQMVAGMSDAELERWERDAYFEALAEHEPERLKAELEQLHDEALQLNAQLEPAPQAAHLLEDEGMIAQETFKQKQQSALAAIRAEKAEKAAHLELVQSEPAAEPEPEPAPEPAAEPEPAPEPAAEPEPAPQPAAELEALELEDVVRRIEQIDLSVEDQRIQKSTYSIKCEHIKEDYQALKRQQNALTANESNQIMPLKIFNKLLKVLGFKSDSELLEPELERLSQAFSNAKSQRELAQSQLTSLKAERDELMQLDVSEPLREAVRRRTEAKERAGDAYVLAHETLRESKIDKSSRHFAERDLQMIRQDLNKADYTVEDMQLVQQRLAEFVDSIDAEVQKQIMREQNKQSAPQQQQRPRSGPRL